jgi:hypothetical protein
VLEVCCNDFVTHVRAYDPGDTVSEGKASYSSMEAALQDLDSGMKAYIEKWGI